MIIKSRVTGKLVLEIFENFQVNKSLPKYSSKKTSLDFIGNDDFQNTPNHTWGIQAWDAGDSAKGNKSWKYRLVSGLSQLLGIHSSKTSSIPHGNTNPLEILLSVKGKLKEVQDYTNRLSLYDETIKQAKLASQTARVEQLSSARNIVMSESLLMASGFKQYLSEDAVIEFATKCQRGLRLDWISNFFRPLPSDVINQKIAADSLMIFDNYAILHYDPDAKAFALTKEQEEAKKDPILFGLIQGVRKLYFIAEWKDDICNLTLDEVAQVLGRQASVINIDPTKE